MKARYVCDCGRESTWERRDGHFWIVCSQKHTSELRVGQVIQAMRLAGEDVALGQPEDAAGNVFLEYGLPRCFGTMIHYGPVVTPFGCEPLPDAATPEKAFLAFIDNLVSEETLRAQSIARCANCYNFNRCKVLSPAMPTLDFDGRNRVEYAQ